MSQSNQPQGMGSPTGVFTSSNEPLSSTPTVELPQTTELMNTRRQMAEIVPWLPWVPLAVLTLSLLNFGYGRLYPHIVQLYIQQDVRTVSPSGAPPSQSTSVPDGISRSKDANNELSRGSEQPTSHQKWFVVIAVYSRRQRSLAEERVNRLRASGYNVHIVDNKKYPELRTRHTRRQNGYWIIAMGPYSKGEAERQREKMQYAVPSAFIRGTR